MKITTTTGAVYTIDNETHHWIKEKNGCVIDGWWTLWGLMQSNDSFTLDNVNWPWNNEEIWDNIDLDAGQRPETGRHMFIRGKNTWWITTPIVAVEDE